jgi:hypothetical protein
VEAPYVDAYREWVGRVGAVTVAAEFPVFHTSHLYGGTVDLVLDLPSGRIICDIKTGKTAGWPEQQLQLAAYRWCDIGVPDGITGASVLHVQPGGVTEIPVDTSLAVFEVFLNVKGIHDWLGGRP